MSHPLPRPYFCFTLLAILSLGLPATGAAKPANQSSSASAQDQQFVNKAWNINTSEVQLGGMAEQQAASSAVKDFGRRMIADHTKLNQELTQVAQEEGLTLPSTLDKHHQKLIDKLSKLHGSSFDRAYMSAMIHGHKSAVSTFEKESKEAAQTPVDQWAGRAAPVLRQHLQMAEQTGKEVGAHAAKASAK